MKQLSFLLFYLLATTQIQAKIWRVNNNAGVAADFTTFDAAANSVLVLAGDTIHLEPSTFIYGTSSFEFSKRLVVIGPGYLLDPANISTPGNAGLQADIREARLDFFYLGNGASGSKFMGVNLSGGLYFLPNAAAINVTFEKVFFGSGFYFLYDGNYDGITIRKSFFYNGASISSFAAGAVITNFVAENNIFNGGAYINLTNLSGTGNIVRNNSVLGGNIFTLNNTYVANNIFDISGQCTFTNCSIKNNLFKDNQTLPGTATGNQVNVNMFNVYVGGGTGSLDSRLILKAGSPAIGAGLTVGGVVSPDCGAFGATDPYKLSGIPNIPSIYSLTVPTSIPSGSTNMTVTFSTRNSN